MSLDALMCVCVLVSVSHLLLGLTVLSLTGLLLDMRCHGEGGTVMAVGQVDDVSDRRQHGSLAAGADDGVSFAHCQQQLTSARAHTHTQRATSVKPKISDSKCHGK